MIKIEKKIALDFMGDEYKDSYVIVRAIPVKEYKELLSKIDTLKEDESHSSFDFVVGLVGDRFVKAEIAQDGKLVEVGKDDLNDLPGEFFMGIMQRLVGNDPKA